jgi:hypothetical protein
MERIGEKEEEEEGEGDKIGGRRSEGRSLQAGKTGYLAA